MHANPLMLLAIVLQCCVNTPIGNNVFHFLRATFASTSASCVNGALRRSHTGVKSHLGLSKRAANLSQCRYQCGGNFESFSDYTVHFDSKRLRVEAVDGVPNPPDEMCRLTSLVQQM